MPGFIAVEHRLLGQGPLEFLARPGDGGTRFFPGLLGTAHADRNLERPFEQAPHDEARQATHDRQVCNQGGQLRSELPLDLVGPGRLRGLAARGTDDWRTLVFGDVRFDRRQLGALIPSRRAGEHALIGPQWVIAMATHGRQEFHRRVHALRRDQRPAMARMSRLPAACPPTLLTPSPRALSAGESIR